MKNMMEAKRKMMEIVQPITVMMVSALFSISYAHARNYVCNADDLYQLTERAMFTSSMTAKLVR